MSKINIKIFFTVLFLNLLNLGYLFANQNPINLDLDKFKPLKPRSIGPAATSGRITTIDVVNSNTNIIYAGAASGGVWKSTSGGIKWEPIFDNMDVQSIGALKIQQTNPDVIWVGTGEGNPRNSVSSGRGIYKSIDGGKTFKLTGLEKTRSIHRIIIDEKNPNTVYVGAIGNPWYAHPERGVFKTTDGGGTWQKVLFSNDSTGCADLVVDPVNSNKMIAAMWEHKREPWFFNSGGEGSGLYITYDGWKTHKKLTDKEGLPNGNLGRIGLAISESQPNIVYALIESKKNAFYKSTDGGENWKKVSDKGFGNRPFYYADIFVDPKNENRVYSIHSRVSISEDGGKHWGTLLDYYDVHPDHHAWWIDSNNPSFMINGNDGGINITRDRGKTWQFVSNLPVAQFYHINIDNEIPYNVYGGMQDNGSWIGPSRIFRYGGIKNQYWEELTFGDGFDVVPDLENPRYGFSMSQQGHLYRYDLKTGSRHYILPTHPDGEYLRFSWNAAISRDHFDNNIVYFGSQYLHKSTDKGANWTIISPDLTTNDSTKLNQFESGGLTYDVTGAENHCTILSISPSPLNPDMIWVGTDDGQIQLTIDKGENWTNLSNNIKGVSKYSWIPQIHASKYDKNECFVVINDYRRGDWGQYLYYTKNRGKSWVNITENKNIDGFILSFIQDNIEPNLMFIGTEFGLYFSHNAGNNWQKWDKGFPSVPVIDLKIHPRESDLIIGTFGRSAWILDNIDLLRKLSKNENKVLENELTLSNVQTSYLVSWTQAMGARFGGDEEYKGDNKSSNARLLVYINKKDKNEKEEKETNNNEENDNNEDESEEKPEIKNMESNENDSTETVKPYIMSLDSLKLEIYDLNGNSIRNNNYKVKDGLNEFHWNLDKKRVRFPNNKKKDDDTDYGSAYSVLPGEYIAKITYNQKSYETKINVKLDPRSDIKIEELSAQNKLLDSIYNKVEIITEYVDKIKESKEIIKSFDAQLINTDKKIKKEIKKLHKKMTDSLDSLRELIYGKRKKGQGIKGGKPNLMNKINTSLYIVGSSISKPSSTGRFLIDDIDNKIEEMKIRFDNFYKNDWQDYKSKITSYNMNIFNE